MTIAKTKRSILVFLVLPLIVSCQSGSDSGDSSSTTVGNSPPAAPPAPPPPPASNRAPTISGSPAASVLVGETYSFTPTASDPDGDVLTFSIENQPNWADFDEDSGSVSGTPPAGSEGMYSQIRISVSDGSASTEMPEFSVLVAQSQLGTVTLTWTAPTQNSDGSALTDLASYRIYYGTTQGNYPNQIDISNPGVTTYVIDNLSPNTYYFVATAVNSQGIESNHSNSAPITVN